MVQGHDALARLIAPPLPWGSDNSSSVKVESGTREGQDCDPAGTT